ncbi:hypothetical protein Droror1_Dr00017176 [Drosera rotundifolia]
MDDLHSHESGGICSMPTTTRLKHWIFVKEHHTFQLQRSAGNLRMNSSTGLTALRTEHVIIHVGEHNSSGVANIVDMRHAGGITFECTGPPTLPCTAKWKDTACELFMSASKV